MSEFGAIDETLQLFLKDVKEKDDALNRGDNDSFAWEFLKIRVESDDLRELRAFACEAGNRTVNLKKNRYRDILPFDFSRVKITPYADDNDSDYINASFINGANDKIAYIATQGPMKETLNDFWQMIVEWEVKTILMLCELEEGGKSKCEQYWPEQGSTMDFGQTTSVANRFETKPQDHYTERKLTLSYDGRQREMQHFCYHGWPDHGTPDEIEPLLDFIEAVRNWQPVTELNPIVVHCSAGCGRSGTFCALDLVRTQLMNKRIPRDFDVFSLVMNLRKQRPAMVQSKDQYVLLHRAIAQMFKHYIQTTVINGDKPPVRPPRRQRNRVVVSDSISSLVGEDNFSLTKNPSSSSVFTPSSNSRQSSTERSPSDVEKTQRGLQATDETKEHRNMLHMSKFIADILPTDEGFVSDNQQQNSNYHYDNNSKIIPKDDLELTQRNKNAQKIARHVSSLPTLNEFSIAGGDVVGGESKKISLIDGRSTKTLPVETKLSKNNNNNNNASKMQNGDCLTTTVEHL